MFKYLSVFLFIGLILGQNPDLSDNDFKKNELVFKKHDKIIYVEPNKNLYINNNKMIYVAIDYNNRLIKLKSQDEVILNFNSVSSFRYEMSPLDKAKDYSFVGAIIGSIYGCSEMVKILNRPNDMFDFVKILAPIAIPWFGGIGGLLGYLTGGFSGIVNPDFSDLLIVGDEEWKIHNNKYF